MTLILTHTPTPPHTPHTHPHTPHPHTPHTHPQNTPLPPPIHTQKPLTLVHANPPPNPNSFRPSAQMLKNAQLKRSKIVPGSASGVATGSQGGQSATPDS